MARRPVLTQYPHLHHILKNDPIANQQFNAVLTEVNGSLLRSGTSYADLEITQKQLELLREDHVELVAFAQKAKTLLRRFGEVLEAQVQLNAYSEDIANKKEYAIKFTADEIRAVLSLHWDVIARKVEDIIAGREVEKEEE